MKPKFIARSAVCAAALLSAPAALADVTAEQVWENWKANLALYGQDGVTTGSEEVGDGTVTVTDLTLTLDDAESRIVSNVGTLTFTENGDGTVSVAMQDSYPVMIEMLPDDGSVELEIAQGNLEITVSGDPDAMNYDVSADTYEVRIVNITGDEEVDGDMFMRANNVSGSYQTDISDGMNTTFGFASSSIDVLVDVKEPDGPGFVVFSGKLDDVSTTGLIDLPEGADMDVPETFATDFTFQSETTSGGTAFVYDINDDGEAVNGSLSAGQMTLGGEMSEDGLDYTVSFADMAVNATSAQMPVPFAMSVSLFENILEMPLAATEEAAPFGYRLALTDFTVNDEIWAMGDPTGAFPRDPATFILDVSGMAKLFFDLLDPEQEAALELAEIPGELISLAINNIQLTAVGAEIKADGDFTFDNTDLETFDGLPRPMGELNVNITGANALLDTLVSMGLLPQEQATMGRMMMGMFTQPAGDDALTSKIEINEQGHVLANGQRIQ